MACGINQPAGAPMSRTESGFTLVEAAVAAFLVVVFFLAFASSVDIAADNSRSNRFSQQATALASAEVDYARVLSWDELAMTAVDDAQPMLNAAKTHLLAAQAGLAADEPLVVDSGGIVAPKAVHTHDGQDYTVWRYVTDAGSDLRRLVVLVVWDNEGNEQTFQTSTMISQVTAGGNAGGVTSTTSPGGSTTTSSSSTTTSTSTSTSTTTTSTTTTSTTTTQPEGPFLHVVDMEIDLDEGKDKAKVEVWIEDDDGDGWKGIVVTGTWSTSPSQPGYPFSTDDETDKNGTAKFTHNDGHPDGTTVQFCVTNVEYPGYTWAGGTHCVSAEWDD